VALLTEPPSISAETVYKDTENPGTPQRLPPRRAPKILTPKKAASPKKVLTPKKAVSPQFKAIGTRLPPCRAPKNQQPATVVTTEAGPVPSGLTVAGYTQFVSGEDLLVLPPLPRDVFEELMTMFDGADSLTELETSDEEAKRRKFGRDTIGDE
jgi:hypothetical protein